MSDFSQRKKALEIDKSFIIQAPAGSGKTELLTQRYLKLLSVSENPENIIAITFTRKAVAELKFRVINALKLAKESEPSQPYKKLTYNLAKKVLIQDDKKNWNLLKNHHQLKISTFDVLHANINNSYIQKDDISNPNTIDNADEFYKLAAKNVLLKIQDKDFGNAVASVFWHLDNNSNNFIEIIAIMLKIRDSWVLQLFDNKQINYNIVDKSINNIIKNSLSNLEQIANHNLPLKFFQLCAANTVFYNLQKIPQNLEEWENLADLCLIKSGEVRKNLNKNNGFPVELKQQKIDFLQIIDSFSSEFVNLLNNVRILPNMDINQNLIIHISKVLMLANIELKQLFIKYNVIDFIQITLNANSVIDTADKVNDISLKLDYQIEHILLDEFQDTSYLQLSIIEKIIDLWLDDSGKTIFLVGDPMQSIYLFRGAQVGVFLQVKEHGIANLKPINLTLTENFRSKAAIVEQNNKIFANMFPKFNDIDAGAVQYSHSTTQNTDKDNSLYTYLFPYNGSQDEASQVLEIINNAPNDDIAILYSSRSHIIDITKLLIKNNIDFELVKGIKLSKHIFTRDLITITSCLLNLNDNLSWYSLLNSPYCGMLLDDLLIFDKTQTIFQQLQNNHSLSTDGFRRANHIFEIFDYNTNNIGSFDFTNILSNTLNNLNINIGDIEQQILHTFIKIINDFITSNHPYESMLDFINNALENSYAPSKKSNIQIMTIWQAKGLEFENVIIVGLGKKSRAQHGNLIEINQFINSGIIVAPKPIKGEHSQTYKYLLHIDSQKHKFEKMRVLYVAMTRAKSNLHLLACKNNKNKFEKNTNLFLLTDLFEDNQLAKSSNAVEKKAQNWVRYESLSSAKFKNIERAEIVESINFDKSANIIGDVLHKLYQLENFNPDITQVQNFLISAGMDIDNLAKISTKIIDTLQKTQNCADFDFIFKNRISTLTEAEFIDENGVLIVDRLFIDNDILWIIDFKTAQQAGNDFITKQKLQHKKQLQCYKSALQNIYPNPIKTAIFLSSIAKLVII